MNTRFQQTSRMGRLSTVLGADELVLLRFFGTESINSLSEFRVEALSNTDEIDFDDLVGTHATVEIDHAEHGPQPFDGIITKARFLGAGENGFRYEFELRPWLWLTSKRRTQQIFHRMTVVEILHDLWAPYDHLGSPAFESHLTGDYPELEYTVQFCESDLDFACRMMERFGISYYFQHAPGSHTLVLFDKAGALENVPGGKRPFYTARSHHSHERFTEWRAERNLTTGAIKLTDYNFKKPGARMLAQRRGNAKHAEGMIESFDWPGRYLELDQGEEFEIRLRLDQERGQDQRQFAVGNCLCLRAGLIVELSGDPVPDATGKSFICLRADHSYVSNAFGTGIEMRAEDHGYSGKYTFMPQTAPVAPRRKTSLARVEGPQTATVVGEGEIDCDEYGRILVRFHWDLDHAYSMRCRVSQNWAGNGWGGMVIPRIGMEVLVEFLDGDPDKPLVTGCVYNGRNDVPYELPEHKTRSTFKTDTHEGSGFNELRFEDKRDAEEIFVHA
ncbi:MAG: type VI secretion system tip protein TssI/VgrG, partial [Pseudomonadota bacterium]